MSHTLAPENIYRDAVFSQCCSYRYRLWRKWSEGPTCVFIGVNPSKANKTDDDRTVTKCIKYANRWGYGSLCMVNLFAYKATDPSVMKKADRPEGAENLAHLEAVCQEAGIVIAAWGNHGTFRNQDQAVCRQLSSLGVRLHCLAVNKTGTPTHPLRTPVDAEPSPFRTNQE